MWGAWQGERFTRVEKLKAWKVYAKEVSRSKTKRHQSDGEKLDVFRSLAAAGHGLTITRIPRKGA